MRFRSAIAKVRGTHATKLTLTLTLTDTGGAVLTVMLGYRSLYITWQLAIAALCDSGLSPLYRSFTSCVLVQFLYCVELRAVMSYSYRLCIRLDPTLT